MRLQVQVPVALKSGDLKGSGVAYWVDGERFLLRSRLRLRIGLRARFAFFPMQRERRILGTFRVLGIQPAEAGRAPGWICRITDLEPEMVERLEAWRADELARSTTSEGADVRATPFGFGDSDESVSEEPTWGSTTPSMIMTGSSGAPARPPSPPPKPDPEPEPTSEEPTHDDGVNVHDSGEDTRLTFQESSASGAALFAGSSSNPGPDGTEDPSADVEPDGPDSSADTQPAAADRIGRRAIRHALRRSAVGRPAQKPTPAPARAEPDWLARMDADLQAKGLARIAQPPPAPEPPDSPLGGLGDLRTDPAQLVDLDPWAADSDPSVDEPSTELVGRDLMESEPTQLGAEPTYEFGGADDPEDGLPSFHMLSAEPSAAPRQRGEPEFDFSADEPEDDPDTADPFRLIDPPPTDEHDPFGFDAPAPPPDDDPFRFADDATPARDTSDPFGFEETSVPPSDYEPTPSVEQAFDRLDQMSGFEDSLLDDELAAMAGLDSSGEPSAPPQDTAAPFDGAFQDDDNSAELGLFDLDASRDPFDMFSLDDASVDSLSVAPRLGAEDEPSEELEEPAPPDDPWDELGDLPEDELADDGPWDDEDLEPEPEVEIVDGSRSAASSEESLESDSSSVAMGELVEDAIDDAPPAPPAVDPVMERDGDTFVVRWSTGQAFARDFNAQLKRRKLKVPAQGDAPAGAVSVRLELHDGQVLAMSAQASAPEDGALTLAIDMPLPARQKLKRVAKEATAEG